MSREPERATSLTVRRYEALGAIMLGGIMGPIAASVVNVILPTVTDYFKAPLATAQWVSLVYLITTSGLLLFCGRLGDILGYKRVYLAGLLFFVVASGLCSLAPSIYWLIAFRAVQGIGAAMMMAVPYAIITAIFPPEERGRALGINAISISAGLAIGPVLGGLLTSLWGWKAALLINIPIGLAGFLWAAKVVPELRGQSGKMDFGGAVSAFVFLFSSLYFLNQVQKVGAGLAPYVGLVAAVISGACFLYVEARSPQPMVNLVLFRNRTFSLATLSALLNFASQYILVFLVPFYLQRILHYSPNKIGMLMTSFPLATMVVAPISGVLSDRLGTRTLAAAGAAVCGVALVTMALLRDNATAIAIVWCLALFGLGTGIFQSPNNSAVMGSVARPYLGIASGVLATARNIGMALGIASAGMILYALVPPAIIAQSSLDAAQAARFLTGLRYAYLFGAVLTVLAAVLSLVQGEVGEDRAKPGS
ncbi:MAG: MFS transporter [Firmicutes bacterium]|nr:MFS transporter [Candidatus Fermentithermobacillaceae bacterium]